MTIRTSTLKSTSIVFVILFHRYINSYLTEVHKTQSSPVTDVLVCVPFSLSMRQICRAVVPESVYLVARSRSPDEGDIYRVAGSFHFILLRRWSFTKVVYRCVYKAVNLLPPSLSLSVFITLPTFNLVNKSDHWSTLFFFPGSCYPSPIV